MTGSDGVRGEDIIAKGKEYIMGNRAVHGMSARNETIDVTVEWNGQIEKLILKCWSSTCGKWRNGSRDSQIC